MKTSEQEKDFDTLSQATAYYNEQGYGENFKLQSDCLEDSDDKTNIQPSDFTVDAIHRFEGMTNPGDNTIMYAITCNNGKKGVAVEAYGADSVVLEDEMRKALQEKMAD